MAVPILIRAGSILLWLGCFWLLTVLLGVAHFTFIQPVQWNPAHLLPAAPEFEAITAIIGDKYGIVFLFGYGLTLLGLRQRRSRRLAWEAVVHNEQFFANHGLRELREDRLRDDQDNGYRLDDVFDGELEFMVLGQRGKRAYLEFDEDGKYTSWSGVVTQR